MVKKILFPTQTNQNLINTDKREYSQQKAITSMLVFESINRSATSESNFSCETSGISGLRFKLFFSERTLPINCNITSDKIRRAKRAQGLS